MQSYIKNFVRLVGPGLVALGLLVGNGALWAQESGSAISQLPLNVGGQVPGNLALVPSVEFPTVISVANLGNYDDDATYVGYFDSGKCYQYVTETFQHVFFGEQKASDNAGYFTPVRVSRTCTNADEWSGNYLNWATTQTIDPFRKALTGGYRTVDVQDKTILEKAARAGRGDYFPARSVNKAMAEKVSPISPVGNMTVALTQGTDYQKNKSFRLSYSEEKCTGSGRRRECSDEAQNKYYSVRVEVCKAAGLLEDNCVPYGDHWKPEGLLQQYAGSIRYSAFSYLNEDGNGRNGGVLRAQQGYIGKTKREPGVSGESDNPDIEWDADTGVLKQNPQDASEGNSGVINYINKFGESTNRHKSNDPVSELYYTALRYFKDQGNVSSYSDNLTDTRKDGFPVITEWDDPIQYVCQKNVVLGIGDVNSHEDRNLPHSDDDLALNDYTNKVFDLEGINKSASAVFTGRGNSAYIAGLAYYANTTDIRPEDKAGKQTIQTYWVDVREGQVLEDKADNQYWLAAKYGGFNVPTDFGDALEREDGLDDRWWFTSGETLESGDKRPDNFFVASDAQNMVDSLKKAFAAIAADMQGSSTATSTNSTRLEQGSKIYLATFRSRDWSGQLEAYELDPETGEPEADPVWNSDIEMPKLDIDTRKIFTSEGLAGSGAVAGGRNFQWAELSSDQQALLGNEDLLRWVRGEAVDGLRAREHLLGDIVNSDPAFVGKEDDYGFHRYGSLTESSTYKAFLATKKTRLDMLYIGANDGMLHGFDAETGAEKFAYIPGGVLADLGALAEPNYQHRYYVDGAPVVSDAFVGGGWKTVLVGTTGAGGKSVFALDVTDPSSASAAGVLWEFSTGDDDEHLLGYTIGTPVIARIKAGNKWVAVFGNGYESGDDNLKLFIVDLATGEPISVITADVTAENNGLASPVVVDSNGDGLADYAYSGDLLGNLWRFDLVAGTSAKLFQATDGEGNPQPITTQPRVARHPDGGLIVLFGTGKFFQVGDNEVEVDPQVQSLYGIRDTGSTTGVERESLLEQTIDFEGLAEFVGGGETVAPIRIVSANSAAGAAPTYGWYLDLEQPIGSDFPATSHEAQGERMVATPMLRHGRIVFVTNISNEDPCAGGGYSWLMELDAFTGSRLMDSVMDVNGDGVIDDNDMVKVGDQELPVSGERLEGLHDMPAVVGVDKDEYKYFGLATRVREKGDGINAGRQSWRQLQ